VSRQGGIYEIQLSRSKELLFSRMLSISYMDEAQVGVVNWGKLANSQVLVT